MLEVEPDRRRDRPRRNIVGTAERRKEVVKRFFVQEINDRQTGAPLVLFGVEQVVCPHGCVEEIALRDPLRVVVVVLGARSGNGYQRGPVFARRAETRGTNRSGRRRMHAAAVKPALELLVGRQVGNVHHRVASTGSVGASFASGAGHRASHQTAVKTPVETDPWELCRRLVLHVPGRVMDFVMIDTEYTKPNGGGADSGDLRAEKARCPPGR